MTSLTPTRRAFLRSAAAAGATAATLSVARAQSEQSWDAETDVLVLGYGGAGAATAIAAHDAGAQVLILEKQGPADHTSNTQMSLGVFVTPDTVEGAVAYMSVAARVNVDVPDSKDIDDDVILAWATEMARNNAWLTALGATGFATFAPQGRDPRWPGNAAIKAYQLAKAGGGVEVGVGLFDFLAARVAERGIAVRWNTPAQSLIVADGAVVGAVARSAQGDIRIRARRAVVLTTGGFNADAQAIKTYLPTYPMAFYGNPGNTGDGLRMAQAVGADLWHMTVLGGGLKAKFDDFPTGFSITFGPGAHIVVDKTGRRFKSESQLGGYSGYWNALVYDTVDYTWPRIPSWLIFDEQRRRAGPMTSQVFGAAGPVGLYRWSADNQAEIDRGWIVTAPTLDELAAKIGMDPQVLRTEVEDYNGFAAAGRDARFGRPATTLNALESPPYYALQLLPGPNNTFGGPRRNARAQILDPFGRPIPRLYGAGELGSVYVQYPQGGANIGECFAFGRIAGTNAAAEAE